MILLNLKPSRISLEFADWELPRLLRRLRRQGKIVRSQYATYDLLTVGGHALILMNDFGESALVSQTTDGDDLLRRVAAPYGRQTSSQRRRNFRGRPDADRLAA